MNSSPDISIRAVNKVGRITLTRPKALNALTYEMAIAIEKALDEWVEGDDIDLVLIDAEGDRAFCAGGDIAQLYETGKAGDYDYGRKFWADEYRLNAKIANLPMPYVAIMDGITMGGGVGISVHGSDRIVTERSMIAMPECGIGLVPDVGGSFVLSRSPGHLGEYLAMTGYRMGPSDAVLAGFGDVQVSSDDLAALKNRIEEAGDLAILSEFASPPSVPSLGVHLDKINEHFSKDSALACLKSLDTDSSDWALETAKLVRRSCPLSVACAFEIIRIVRNMASVRDALQMEYRFVYRAMEQGDFIEGIRAQIIDKDRKPNWKIPNLEQVTQTHIHEMLSPSGSEELWS